MVAGIASLLISRDSTLHRTRPGKRGIEEIIKYSAIRQLEGRTIDTADVKFGWGRVDAFRAVLSIARGDADNDGFIDIEDITALIDYLYLTLEPLFPTVKLGDCDCDGIVDIADLTVLINYLYIPNSGVMVTVPCYVF